MERLWYEYNSHIYDIVINLAKAYRYGTGKFIKEFIQCKNEIISLLYAPKSPFLFSLTSESEIWIHKDNKIEEMSSYRPLQSEKHYINNITIISLCPNEDFIFGGASNGKIIIWEFSTLKLITTINYEICITGIHSISQNLYYLLFISDENGRITVYTKENEEIIFTLVHRFDTSDFIKLSQETYSEHNRKDAMSKCSYIHSDLSITAMAFQNSTDSIVFGTSNGLIGFFKILNVDLENQKKKGDYSLLSNKSMTSITSINDSYIWEAHKHDVTCISIVNYDNVILSSSNEGYTSLWDFKGNLLGKMMQGLSASALWNPPMSNMLINAYTNRFNGQKLISNIKNDISQSPQNVDNIILLASLGRKEERNTLKVQDEKRHNQNRFSLVNMGRSTLDSRRRIVDMNLYDNELGKKLSDIELSGKILRRLKYIKSRCAIRPTTVPSTPIKMVEKLRKNPSSCDLNSFHRKGSLMPLTASKNSRIMKSRYNLLE